uniref:Histone-binding protein RBBP4-like N-terminal domain-containing protein n=1 Tax=Dunaliella tertiolecta TaxID=3047 RepID=A0A7S3VQR3_DUNTE
MDETFVAWREKLAPLIYDMFSHHNLPWPTQACRFGSAVEDLTYKTRYRVYYSEQTDDSEPQKLIVATADVCKPNVASAEVVSSWTDFSKSPYLREEKVLFHPGEVNKIREIPQHPGLVVTHTDAPEVLLWNVDKQPHRPREKKNKLQESIPDMKLVGHEDEALFPLATTPAAPLVASGGNDCLVMLWDLADSTTSLLAGSCGGSGGAKDSPELRARHRFEGHTRPVEEVVFKPGSMHELASVGDDAQLMFWDVRSGAAPVLRMKEAHGPKDIQCVDWSPLAEHCVATGAQDGSIKVWDTRALRGPDHTICSLRSHTDAIIRLEWHPQAKGVLASGGDDRVMMVWNINVDAPPADRPLPPEASKKKSKAGVPTAPQDVQRPKELMMQHSGHRRGKVVDFQWCPTVPWAIMSVSDDGADEESGGGSLQLWRPSSLLYEPQEKVLARLNQHRTWILEGRNPPERQPLRVERAQEELAESAARAARDNKEGKEAKAKDVNRTGKRERQEKQEGVGSKGAGASMNKDSSNKEKEKGREEGNVEKESTREGEGKEQEQQQQPQQQGGVARVEEDDEEDEEMEGAKAGVAGDDGVEGMDTEEGGGVAAKRKRGEGEGADGMEVDGKH